MTTIANLRTILKDRNAKDSCDVVWHTLDIVLLVRDIDRCIANACLEAFGNGVNHGRTEALQSKAPPMSSEYIARLEARIHDLERFAHAGELPRAGGEDRTIDSLDRHFDGRCDSLSQRCDALEEWRKQCATAVIPWPADVLSRLDSLDTRLRTVEARTTTMWDHAGYDKCGNRGALHNAEVRAVPGITLDDG